MQIHHIRVQGAFNSCAKQAWHLLWTVSRVRGAALQAHGRETPAKAGAGVTVDNGHGQKDTLLPFDGRHMDVSAVGPLKSAAVGNMAWLSRRLSQTQRPKGRPRPRKLRQGEFDGTGHFSEVVAGMNGNQRPNEGPLYVPMGHPGQLSCPFGLFGDVRVLAPPPKSLRLPR